MKDIIVIAGPNGAGKTTLARVLLPIELGLAEFVNADIIAAGLSPFNPDGAAIAAGRIMLDRMRALARAGRSFAFETTCAGTGHARFLRLCHAQGWRVTLIFLWLDDPATALRRVAERVAAGGHAVPAPVVIRRYHAGLRNLLVHYLPLADTARIYDNSAGLGRLIARQTLTDGLRIIDPVTWLYLTRTTHARDDG